jgi:hypothetical protein
MDQTELLKEPKVRLYLAKVKREVLDDSVHARIAEQLLQKAGAKADEAVASGRPREIAIAEALASLGKPQKVGRDLNRMYKLSYFDSHYGVRFFQNCIGLVALVALMTVFTFLVKIPFAWLVFLLSVTSGVSAWLTFKRFLKPVYFLLNAFGVPVYVLYQAADQIAYKIRAYNALLRIANPDYPFVIEWSVYLKQAVMAVAVAGTAMLVTLWLHAGEYMSAKTGARARTLTAVLMAAVLFLSVGQNASARIHLDEDALNALTAYWTDLKADAASVESFADTGVKTDLKSVGALGDLARVMEGYVGIYGTPGGYALNGSAASYLSSVQTFLYGKSLRMDLLAQVAPPVPDAERIRMVREFFGKLQSTRQEVSDLREENVTGMIRVLNGVEKAYRELLDGIAPYRH